MKDEYTGGPAFPAAHFDLSDHEHGMSLRDYFAAKAMQSEIIGNEGLSNRDGFIEAVARISYRMADAMLKARQG